MAVKKTQAPMHRQETHKTHGKKDQKFTVVLKSAPAERTKRNVENVAAKFNAWAAGHIPEITKKKPRESIEVDKAAKKAFKAAKN